MNPIEKTLEIKGHTVHYWVYHPDKSQRIVMIHGFRGTHHGLDQIASQLTDYQIIVPDLPGFGKSTPFIDSQHTLDHYVAFLSDFMTEIGDTPYLLGHSFGSIITSHYTATKKHSVKKLVLINPIGAPALQGSSKFMTQLAIGYYFLGRTLPARMAHAWLSTPVIVKVMSVAMAKTKDKEMKKFIHQQHLQHFSTFANPTVVAESFRTSVENDVSHVAAKITIPTLLIAGEKDDITPLKKQHVLHGTIKKSDLVVIDQVGHLIHYEKSTEAAAAVRAFLKK